MVLILLSGYGKISDSAFRMRVTRMIAGEGMFRLVAAQYVGKSSGRENRSYEGGRTKSRKYWQCSEKIWTKSKETRWRKLCLTGRTMRTVPGQDSPLTMAPMQHIHPCFWMACISVEFMPHFFLWEKNIEGKEEIVKQMQKDGHLIGNHTYDHVQLDKLPGDQACQQILKTNNEIYEITGEYPLYLRPPYGAWPKNLELCVTMLPVFWDVDTLDWKSKTFSLWKKL